MAAMEHVPNPASGPTPPAPMSLRERLDHYEKLMRLDKPRCVSGSPCFDAEVML